MTPLELAAALRVAPPAPDTERSPTNDKPLHPTNGPFRWDPKHGNWVADLTAPDTGMREAVREAVTAMQNCVKLIQHGAHQTASFYTKKEYEIYLAALTAAIAKLEDPS